MAGFIYKLQNIVNTSPDSDGTDINIARCLLKNIENIKKNISLQEISEICYTSPASISRFSHRLGYSNFNEFKLDCLGLKEELDEMIIDNKAFQNMDLPLYAKKIINCFQQVCDETLDLDLDQLCNMIHEAKRVIVFATHIPGDLANILQRALLVTGKYVEFYPRKEHQIEIVKQVSEDDLCIFISLGGMLLMEKSITIPAIISSARNVLITQNSQIKFSHQFTKTIVLGNYDEESLGKYKLLFFIDGLVNRYYKKYIVAN
ncbi:MurR/RpiR family transcriptional regulator [Clostridium paraputrificum]|uniref:MurR/RpiR family transcriptional regulator n=1 Tax=Clostridium paraputrificum TaxID=29363 RepID=UPI00189EA56B|nr:MurR/RpiR family transcriptional regulator [Clostridium paraputrificum]